MKTIERAHTPNRLWEKLKLPQNYRKALEIIDDQLQYWPKFLIHKNKQRLTKFTVSHSHAASTESSTEARSRSSAVDKREKARRKGESEAAENTIEAELLEDCSPECTEYYNFNKELYDKTLEFGRRSGRARYCGEEYDSDGRRVRRGRF